MYQILSKKALSLLNSWFFKIQVTLIFRSKQCSTFGPHKNTNTLKTTTKFKIVKGVIAIVLIFLMSQSFAQSKGIRSHRLSRYKNTRDFGIELSVSAPRFQLQSNISELKNLHTSYLGGNVGGVFVTNHSKVRVTLGLFSSDNSTPYPVDLFQGGASWSLYLLKIKEGNSHLFEPYLILGANFTHSKFYGNYSVPDLSSNSGGSNLPYLGQAAWASANTGLGIEYHLETETTLKFTHVFIQATYGIPAVQMYSDKAFSQTIALSGVTYTLGINFALSR